MDNSTVIVCETPKGKGVFATADILKGEIIGEFDGDIYEAEKCSLLPPMSGTTRYNSLLANGVTPMVLPDSLIILASQIAELRIYFRLWPCGISGWEKN